MSAWAGDAIGPAEETPAERGYRWLTTKAFFAPSLDTDLFDNLWRVWEEPARTQAEMATPQERRKLAYSRYGWTVATGREGEIPLQYVDNGQGGWAVNCFSCHGGKVAGVVMPGAPNTHIALQTLTDDVELTKQLMGKSHGYMDVGLGNIPLGGSNGTSNAVIYGVVLGAKRDLNLRYRPTPIMPKLLHHDHDAPPWWNVKRKARLYADNFAPKTYRALMPFLMVPENGPDEFASFENDFKDILAWIESLEPPKYPWDIDQTLAEQGRVAFNDTCARCHGTYGPGGEYPEKIVAIDEVGTDPVRLHALTPLYRFGHQISWFGHFGKSKTVTNPGGYLAPPLDGIWASAPYFHNGSVPTVWHVLHPEQRPVVWKRTEDGYDRGRLGLEVQSFSELPATQSDVERRTFFDTRLPGKSATGHPFADELSAEQKQAVLEYLKTL